MEVYDVTISIGFYQCVARGISHFTIQFAANSVKIESFRGETHAGTQNFGGITPAHPITIEVNGAGKNIVSRVIPAGSLMLNTAHKFTIVSGKLLINDKAE